MKGMVDGRTISYGRQVIEASVKHEVSTERKKQAEENMQRFIDQDMSTILVSEMKFKTQYERMMSLYRNTTHWTLQLKSKKKRVSTWSMDFEVTVLIIITDNKKNYCK